MKVIPWSYSSLTAFENCPRQFYLTRLAKVVKEPESEAIRWGNYVHKALECRVRDKTPLPEQLAKYEPLAARFDRVRGTVLVEHQYSLTRNLEPCGWWDKDAWCRAKIDVAVCSGQKVALFDWKTGKIKHDSEQLKLSAAIVMAASRTVTNVTTGFVWLPDNRVTKEQFARDDTADIWQNFMSRTTRLELAFKNNKWVPRPSGLCRGWCPVGRQHCEYWSPKKT